MRTVAMAVAVTAKRDAARTRGPSHPVYDRMADGWLAGWPVCRSAWQGPTHDTCASALFVPPRIRTLLASPLSLVLPLRLFLHVSRRPVTLSLGKVEEPRSEAFFLYWHSRPPSQSPPPLPTPRHGIESSRHGVRMDGERETEKKKDKKNER